MSTTIQISEDLKAELTKRKLYTKETYEDVIWDLIEDTVELSEETVKDIEAARMEFAAGKGRSLADVKKELGL